MTRFLVQGVFPDGKLTPPSPTDFGEAIEIKGEMIRVVQDGRHSSGRFFDGVRITLID